jgi:hypothetical protein
LATQIKEWGLKQAVGLRTFPARKFTPFFFFNKLTTFNKEKKKWQKEKKINYIHILC